MWLDGIPVRMPWGPRRMPFPIAGIFRGWSSSPVNPEPFFTMLHPSHTTACHIPELYQISHIAIDLCYVSVYGQTPDTLPGKSLCDIYA